MFEQFHYPIPDVLKTDEFWVCDFDQGDILALGMGGIFWLNEKGEYKSTGAGNYKGKFKDEYFGYLMHEIYLLPGQTLSRPPSQMGQGYGAKSWGSHASKLTEFLDGHEDTNLTAAEKEKIYTWMDLNGIYYPSYECAFPKNPAGRSPISSQQLNRLAKLCNFDVKAGLRWNTHPGALISFDRLEQSPCLKALDENSEAYREALAIIKDGQHTLKTTPRADMAGFAACESGQQRTMRYEELQDVESAYRQAVLDGKKLYDADMQESKPTGKQP